MSASVEEITRLERANYLATRQIAEQTPGLTLRIRDDLILTGSQIFPTPDTTHACLLQTTPQAADALIEEAIAYFQAQSLPVTVYLSPACAPSDLHDRLLKRGFVQQADPEAWLTFSDLLSYDLPAVPAKFTVRSINKDEALIFARVFLTAFEMPLDYAPPLADLLTPSIGLPGVFHYLAWLGDKPLGVFSLMCYRDVGIIGSAGVVPAHRRSGVVFELTLQAARDAKGEGVDTLVLQTTAGAPLERLLRLYGFKRVFTRTAYNLGVFHLD
jgi:hypothetical protein